MTREQRQRQSRLARKKITRKAGERGEGGGRKKRKEGACRSHQELRDQTRGVAREVRLEVAWSTKTKAKAKVEISLRSRSTIGESAADRTRTHRGSRISRRCRGLHTVSRLGAPGWRSPTYIRGPVPSAVSHVSENENSPSAARSHAAQGAGTRHAKGRYRDR